MATNLKGSLQVTIVIVFRMWLLTSDIFGRWCSETVVLFLSEFFYLLHFFIASSFSETVTTDNDKTRFILCEKQQGWIYGNASASLKNPLKCEIVTNAPVRRA